MAEVAPTLDIYRSAKPKKASTLAIDHGRLERHIKPILATF